MLMRKLPPYYNDIDNFGKVYTCMSNYTLYIWEIYSLIDYFTNVFRSVTNLLIHLQ